MNAGTNLAAVRVSWGDLVAFYTEREELLESLHYHEHVRLCQDHAPGFYQQSSGSIEADNLRGITTLGDCYTHPSFEIKLK